MTGATSAVIRMSHAASGSIPDHTRDMARLCMLDWFGLTLAGMSEPVARMLLDAARTEGALPVATILGHGRSFSVPQAALVNGAAGHALDYDDVSLSMNVHPTAVLMPGLLALAEQRRLSGPQLLRAFVAGYEAAGLIGRMMARSHYARGFHATGTIGTFAAAAACAHLIGLDAQTTARAYGLAGSQAAGLKAQFGTMAKPLHAGMAAEAGVRAALWAEAGMTARPDILEAAQGFAATQSAGLGPLPAWDEYELDQNQFKFHAACFGTHGTLEAIGRLLAEGLLPAEVARITVKVHPGLDRMCNIVQPCSGGEAKFSLRFNAALALHGYATDDIATYADAIIKNDEIAETASRVDVDLAPEDWPEDVTEVTIMRHDGTTLVAQHDVSVMPADHRKLRHRIEAKYLALASPVIGPDAAYALAAVIEDIDHVTQADALCWTFMAR